MKHIKLFESREDYWFQLLLMELKKYGNIYDAFYSIEEELPASKAKLISIFCAWVQRENIQLNKSNIESRYKEFGSIYTASPKKFADFKLVDPNSSRLNTKYEFVKGKKIYVMEIGKHMIQSDILSYDEKTQTLTLKIHP